MEKFWPTCLSRFEQELSAQQFNTWIKPLQLEVGDNAIRLLAPNKFVQQWVKERFLGKIESIAAELLPNNTLIELAICEKSSAKKAIGSTVNKNILQTLNANPLTSPKHIALDEKKSNADLASSNSTNRRVSERGSGLNPSFNFNNYVTGLPISSRVPPPCKWPKTLGKPIIRYLFTAGWA